MAQSLFAVGAGGWFGMGLFEGTPEKIPIAEKDFVFAAICEELGGLFCICMLLVCMSCFLMIINISMRMNNRFYKLIALGLGAEYAFQVFLTVGGSINFIPLTGITLPLVAYGGSSVIATILVFAIIQGLYILREDEGEQIEKQKHKKDKPKKPGKPGRGNRRKEEREEYGEKTLEEKIREQTEKVSTGKEYVIVAYLFVGIFLSLIGYMVYFNVKLKDDVINSPYNSRQNAYEERIVRGEILANDGTVLARTDTDEEGNETRVYPMGEVFAHVVGYMASGKSGLESSENYTLLTSHANPVEKVTNEFREEKNKGDNLVTTLDANLQQVAYDALQTNGAVVVMEPDTGKILACVSKPDFDPNTLAEQWDEIVNDSENSSLVNRAFQGLYPPGSTFKIVTALSYLRQNGTLDGFSFDCEGN